MTKQRFTVVPAVYILFERGNQILLIRRFNTGYEDGNYTLPSGHLDGDESPSMAAIREAREEVGVGVDRNDLRFIHCMAYKSAEGDHERVSYFFRAQAFTGEPQNMEPAKCDDIGWFPRENLPENIVWELRHALRQIDDDVPYSETNY